MADSAVHASGSGQDSEPPEEEKPLGDIESGGEEDVEPEPFIEREVPPGEKVRMTS
jgi:hypothetical protein